VRGIRLGIAVAWLAGVSVLAAPQLAGLPATTTKSFRSAVDLVTLNVTITDTRNRQVTGLGRDDFLVLENGVPQPVSFFAAADVPLEVTLLVDASSSMSAKMPFVKKAAEGFIKSLRPSDRASVVGFTTRVRVLQPLTSDPAALMAAINGTAAAGDTALYSAVYVTLHELTSTRQVATEVRRRAVIVLTDGQDTASPIQFDDLLDLARRAGIAIYPISILDESEVAKLAGYGGRRFLYGPDYALKTLARDTGGQAFFPTELTDLDGVYKAVAQELSLQYAIGYVPTTGLADGGYRSLLVRVPTHPELKSRTRTGYFAPGPVNASIAR